MNDMPTAKHERAARAWRKAKTGREAWHRFAAWAVRTMPYGDATDGDAPYRAVPMQDQQLWTGPSAKRLIVFEKYHVMSALLSNERGPAVTPGWKVATTSAPFSISAFDVSMLRGHAKLLGATMSYVGDLDPHGLHVFGALRSGNLEMNGRGVPIRWIGIGDDWISRAQKTTRSLLARTIRMGWIEREYWGVVKRLVPDARALVGDESFALLESGSKLEADAFTDVVVDAVAAALQIRPAAKRRKQ